jgi:hypothetical protein
VLNPYAKPWKTIMQSKAAESPAGQAGSMEQPYYLGEIDPKGQTLQIN